MLRFQLTAIRRQYQKSKNIINYLNLNKLKLSVETEGYCIIHVLVWVRKINLDD